MQKVSITNEAERQAAFERMQELTGCIHSTDEQRELEALTDAIEAYDVEHAVASGVNEQSK